MDSLSPSSERMKMLVLGQYTSPIVVIVQEARNSLQMIIDRKIPHLFLLPRLCYAHAHR